MPHILGLLTRPPRRTQPMIHRSFRPAPQDEHDHEGAGAGRNGKEVQPASADLAPIMCSIISRDPRDRLQSGDEPRRPKAFTR